MARDRETEARARKAGRRKNRWKIRVVRIDARKYPRFAADSAHPFISMAAEARIEEIDSFCARLRARPKKRKKPRSGLSVAA